MSNDIFEGDQLKLEIVFTNTRKIDKAIPLTNSEMVSEKAGIQHKNTKELITKYMDKFNELGNIDKKGFAEHMRLKRSGRKGVKGYKEYYELNENQVNFLITLFKNTPQVVDFKFQLVKEFSLMKDIIQTQLIERRITKEHRRILTDAIQEHIGNDGREYAKFTNLCYNMLFGKTAMQIKDEILRQELLKCETDEQKRKVNKDIQAIVRDYFTDRELKSIERIEGECATLIRIGMAEEQIKSALKSIYPKVVYVLV